MLVQINQTFNDHSKLINAIDGMFQTKNTSKISSLLTWEMSLH